MGFEVLEWRFVTDKKIKDSIQPDCVTASRCPSGWSGYTCDVAAAPVDSSATGGSKSHSSDHLCLKSIPRPAPHPLRLFLLLQTRPPSLSLCSCCCCWRCWRLAPSCGISGECEGESAFQRVGGQLSILFNLVLTSALSLLFFFLSPPFSPLITTSFLSPRSLWPGKSRSQSSR